MINEIYTGNNLLRILAKIPPFHWGSNYVHGHTEYQIPDVLDFHLPQPGGITLRYQGPRNSMDIRCLTSQRDISFKDLSVEGTQFSIGKWYFANHQDLMIEIPSNFIKLGRPIRWSLHEIGHLWSLQDEEWLAKYSEAGYLLNDQSICRDPWDERLPRENSRLDKELEAEKIIGQEERKADGVGIYIVGRLRIRGFDLMPGTNDPRIQRMINEHTSLRNKHKRHPGFDFRFNIRDVSAIMSGELPWLNLKRVIDERLNALELPATA